MHVRACVRAEAGPGGATVLPELSSSGPLALRRTGPTGGPEGAATVHLVGAAAGPLGGDRWRLEVSVGAGAVLHVRSAAASVALPGPDGAASRYDVVVAVAPGGVLDWAPEPLVAAAGARHVTHARVVLAEGAGLRWREELACGRHGEATGSARTVLAVSYGPRPLLAHDLAVGPAAAGWDSPAVLGDARAVGTLLLAGTCCPAAATVSDGRAAPEDGDCSANFATMRLHGPGVLVTAVGTDALAVGRTLSSAATRLSTC
jgi:urease accessory protein